MLFILGAIIVFTVPFLWPLATSATPQPPGDEESMKWADDAEAEKRLRWTRVAMFPGVIVCWAACSLPVGLLLYLLYEWELGLLPASAFHLRTHEAVIGLGGAAILSGLMAGLGTFEVLQRRLMRHTALDEYNQYELACHGLSFDGYRRVVLWASLVSGVLSTGLLLVVMPCHVRADGSGIHVRGFFSWREEGYPFPAIGKLALSTHRRFHDTTQEYPALHVWLADGRRLTLRGMGIEDERFLEWLAEKAGKQVEVVTLPEDVGK